ncbi:MAG: carboxypeptidase-like regulatory domain-containing protein, partial [Gammaproteobacteria bacterium]
MIMESFRFKQNFLMVVFIFSISVSANETLTVVNGEVSDIDTGETLPFAKVELKQTNQVIVANQNGRFTLIDVPIGSILVISKTGYEGTEIIISSEIQKLAIGLSKYNSDNFMEEVMVTAKTPQKIEDSGISQYSLSPELTNSLPNLGEQDIFRSMQLLPGVSGSNESSSGLIVRGGTIDQNLVLFDDFTVYHVDHVFGFFSAFNNNAIKDVQFYKGGFSAKYGGRMSSVVDITGKDGNTEQFN